MLQLRARAAPAKAGAPVVLPVCGGFDSGRRRWRRGFGGAGVVRVALVRARWPEIGRPGGGGGFVQ